MARQSKALAATDGDFSRQLKLFEIRENREFSNAEAYSNGIEVYDLLPKYSMAYKRYLEICPENAVTHRTFFLAGHTYHLTIKPASITRSIQGVDRQYYVYAGAKEELVEDAIRKLCVSGNAAFVNGEAACYFKLNQLQKTLKATGHTYSIGDIKESLEILNGTHVEVIDGTGTNLMRSTIFPQMGLTSRADLKRDFKTKCFVIFNVSVSRAIIDLQFRAFNYAILMNFKQRLSRWFFKRISIRWKHASALYPYRIGIETIFNDAGMKPCQRMTHNHQTVVRALNELIANNVLLTFDSRKIGISGRLALPKQKIINITYTLFPSEHFVSIQRKVSAIAKLKAIPK